MRLIAGFLGISLLLGAVSDAVQTVFVARHVHKLPAITRMFYELTWTPLVAGARLIRSGNVVQDILAPTARCPCSCT